MIFNFNVGLVGHVDSGKTTLARVLSTIGSTAAFDKNPQSQERGITLDLGFSAVLVNAPTQVKCEMASIEKIQFTFVDCPGHASLIRTIIGGAQIIDLMILVIDAQKGIQTQTAECIVIGEILKRRMIVVINKIDLLNESTRESEVEKLTVKLRKTLAKTSFGAEVPIYSVSAVKNFNIQELLEALCGHVHLPKRSDDLPFVMLVDHCFPIKGQGTVCTGTIIQGKIMINDTIELPTIRERRKVKSIQMFHRPVQSAMMGDRVGVCLTQFNAKLLERGILTQPGYLQPIFAAVVHMERINYYKSVIKSKSKLHVTVGHDTVMSTITLFRDEDSDSKCFDINKEYEYVEELEVGEQEKKSIFVLLQFDKAILAVANSILIASKLDMDTHSSSCRLGFWGNIQWLTHSTNYVQDELIKFKIFKRKVKQGTIQRLVNDHEAIVQDLFKKESNRNVYVGCGIELSTGERGTIRRTFGQTSKVQLDFPNGIKADTISLLNSKQQNQKVLVLLKFKKFVFNKTAGIVQ